MVSVARASGAKPSRPVLVAGLALVTVVVLAGCAIVRGPADRTDEFTAAGQRCTGSWWLGDLREGTGAEAERVAREALRIAEVSADRRNAASSLLDDSKNDVERKATSAVDLESEAYMLAVTLQVKDALEEAGYPDSDRVMEIWSERRCS